MKYFIISCFALFFISTNAIAAKKKKRTSKIKTEKVVANTSNIKSSSLELCNSTFGMPTWHLNMVNGFQFPQNFQAPAHYRLVSINDKLMDEYLKTIPYEKSNMKINVPVFMNNTIDCKEFMIERVTTMDSALQAKYPNIMSFKMYDKTNSLNTGRLDCDGISTKVMMTINNETYFVTPITFNKKNYYACYSKNDPNLKKQAFER